MGNLLPVLKDLEDRIESLRLVETPDGTVMYDADTITAAATLVRKYMKYTTDTEPLNDTVERHQRELPNIEESDIPYIVGGTANRYVDDDDD